VPGGDVPDRHGHAVQPCLRGLQRWLLRNRAWIHRGIQLFCLQRWDVRTDEWPDGLCVLFCWNLLRHNRSELIQHLPTVPSGNVSDRDRHAVQPGVHGLRRWLLRHGDWTCTGLQLHRLHCRNLRADSWLDDLYVLFRWHILCGDRCHVGQYMPAVSGGHVFGRSGGQLEQRLPLLQRRLLLDGQRPHDGQRLPGLHRLCTRQIQDGGLHSGTKFRMHRLSSSNQQCEKLSSSGHKLIQFHGHHHFPSTERL